MRDTPPMNAVQERSRGFSERDFYLAEFRGRTLALALPTPDVSTLDPLRDLLSLLAANDTRVLLLCDERAPLEKIVGREALIHAESDPGWLGGVWRELRAGLRAGLVVARDGGFTAACRRIALRLRVVKLVWIDPKGGLTSGKGERLSSVDAQELDALIEAAAAPDNPIDPARLDLLREIRRMLSDGLPAVNLCTPAGLERELLTYAGSGTFFTRESYTELRELAIDEFDAAHDLVRRGVEEDYLLERSAGELEEVLVHAFGAFIEGRFLAGIGALLPHPGDRAGEVAALYTLTRFLGEGIGGDLVRFALELAEEREMTYVFACTTSDRVRAFFERNGFRVADGSEIPAQKWQGYDDDRRRRIFCLRRDLTRGGTSTSAERDAASA